MLIKGLLYGFVELYWCTKPSEVRNYFLLIFLKRPINLIQFNVWYIKKYLSKLILTKFNSWINIFRKKLPFKQVLENYLQSSKLKCYIKNYTLLGVGRFKKYAKKIISDSARLSASI